MIRTIFIVWCSCLLLSPNLFAQDYFEQKEKDVDNLTGFEKLGILNLLTDHYSTIDNRKARKYGKEANSLADELMLLNSNPSGLEVELLIDSKLKYGAALYNKTTYDEAQTVYESSKTASIKYSYNPGISESENYLSLIDSILVVDDDEKGFFNKAGSAIANSATNLATSSEIKLAQIAESRGDTTEAIGHYEKARQMLEKRGDQEQADEINDKILTYRAIQRVDSIQTYLVNQEKERGDGKVLDHRIALDSTGAFMLTKVDSSQTYETEAQTQNELADLRVKIASRERAGDYEGSLSYFKQFIALQQKYQKDSANRALAIREAAKEMELLQEKNKNADLSIASIKSEKEAEVQIKNFLMVVAVLIALATIFVLIMYLSKRKKHSQLAIAFSDLDAAKSKLEVAEQKISKLLKQQVSPEIASALMQDNAARGKQFVAIMFLDIRGFTPKAEKMDPEQLIEYQNNVFGFMIDVIEEHHGNVNQFMGDGFMATFGAPVSHGNDPRNAYLAGVEILAQIKARNEAKLIPQTTLGIGIHAGFVVTGNVGTESRKQFSVTGNTVIIAARVEQLNKTYDSQMIITEEVHKSLMPGDVEIEHPEMESVNIKGRTKAVKIIIIDKVQNPASKEPI